MAVNIFKMQAVRPATEAPLFVYLPGLLTSSYKTDRSIIVDWGDGTVETVARSTEISGGRHEVTKEGLYTVSLTYSDDMVLAINSDDYNDPHFFCSYVTEVTLAENIALTDYALSGCPQLTKVTMLGATPPKLWEHTLTQNANLTAIYVPYSAVNAYKTAAVWSTFADIIKEVIPMKTVQSGAHYTTITVDTAEEVKFSFPSTSLSVEAAGGDITVALTETAQAGDDETITVPDGESRMFIHHRMNVDTYYLTGNGTATLYASNMGDVNPFKGKAKGGDGGGTLGLEEVVLWENDGTTNPETITLSEAITDFDEIVIEALYKSGVGKYLYTNSWLASADLVGMRVLLNDEQCYCAYTFTTSTTLTNHTGAEIVFAKIIGRRYTKVNPTGYRRVTLWENEGTTNPQTITLSEAITNFDEVMFFLNTKIANQGAATNIYLADDVIVESDNLYGVGLDMSHYVWYKCSTSTALTLYAEATEYHTVMTKIIGIKY